MEDILSREEKLVRAFRALCSRYGYRPYRMSKFEEYDLYADNRGLLPPGGVITFTDTNGRLMALKPDVTLSIAKNLTPPPGGSVRVYYDESVYRAPDRQLGFQEITQAGLEYLGEVDAYAVGEAAAIARAALDAIEPGGVLDITHMGCINGLIDAVGAPGRAAAEIMRAVSQRNAHGVRAVCAAAGISGAPVERLCRAVGLYGPLRENLPALAELSVNAATERAVGELTELAGVLDAFGALEGVNLDLAIAGDGDYYDGVAFKGYVPGVPSAVLSGGRYDKVLERLGKSGGAVGFALYLNLLERLYDDDAAGYDADVLLITGDAPPHIAARAAREITAAGYSVRAERSGGRCRCRRRARIDEAGEAEYLD